jgi:RluA family pseudouridine synthase
VQSTIKLSSAATREFWEIPVLYQDGDLVALAKPAGLLTAREGDDPERLSLMALLHQAIREQKPWVRESGISYLANVYRLDPETSGVLLLARSKAVLAKLADFFGSEKPAREFLALVQGSPQEQTFQIDASLAPNPARPGRMRVDPHGGKRARSEFEAAERFTKWTLVRCRPLTDRPHQLRVHLRYAGCPIVGDSLYGGRPLLLSRLKADYHLKPGREERPLLGTAALHAHKLFLPHPVTAAPVEVVAPVSKDFQVALKYLRKFAAETSPVPAAPGSYEVQNQGE